MEKNTENLGWMQRLQYELDRAEWMVSETLECEAMTEEKAIKAIQGKGAVR